VYFAGNGPVQSGSTSLPQPPNSRLRLCYYRPRPARFVRIAQDEADWSMRATPGSADLVCEWPAEALSLI
jgi:hypothetical protein